MVAMLRKRGAHPLAVVALVALALAGCGGMSLDSDGGHDAGPDGASDGGDDGATYVKPAGYASVTFFVDDTANRTYAGGELRWMGTFIYDPETNVVVHDPNWGLEVSSYPPLYDDGPISQGGHEMPGATAGDHIFSTEVYVLADPAAATAFKYGVINTDGNWIWEGDNGTFSLPAGTTERINAAGYFIPAFGTYDLKLVLDTSQLNPVLWPFDPQTDRIAIQGSMGDWSVRALADDGETEISGDEVAGDGKYTYLHSTQLGPHDGLLNAEQPVQFVFLIGDREYRTDARVPPGMRAWTNCAGAFEPATILLEPAPPDNQLVPTVVVCGPAGQLPVGPVIPPRGSAVGGTPVSIYGDGFSPEAQVLFGETPAAQVEVVAAGQINCLAPAGASGPVGIRVSNPDGEFGTLPDGYTYTDRLGPEVRHVWPASGPTSGGTELTLSGLRFSPDAEVIVGGLPAAQVTWLDDRRLTCLSPAHAAGTVSVVVDNPDGTSGTLAGGFDYSDEPAGGPTWAVTLAPVSLMLYAQEDSPAIAGRVAVPGLTTYPGCHQAVSAQIGWGPWGSDPVSDPGAWDWEAASCNADCPTCGGADEYHGWLPAYQPGELAYAFRFSLDGGQTWTLADTGAGSSDGFQPEAAGRLTVLAPGAGPLVRGLEPAAVSVLGGTVVGVDGVDFDPELVLSLDDLALPFDFLSAGRLQFVAPPGPPGPADLLLADPQQADRRALLPDALVYAPIHTPDLDGLIQIGPQSEWPEALLVAINEQASDWGPNRLDALWVSYDQGYLFLALEGWVDPSAGNAVEIFIDVDYGTGIGLTDANQLVDDTGYEDLPGLDAALTTRWRVTDPAFGAEFAVGSVGMAEVGEEEFDPAVRALAGLRRLDDPAHLEWLPAEVRTNDAGPGHGTLEFAIPWSSLFAGGLAGPGTRMALFVRIASPDGEHLSNACLPSDDPADPASVDAVFTFEVQ